MPNDQAVKTRMQVEQSLLQIRNRVRHELAPTGMLLSLLTIAMPSLAEPRESLASQGHGDDEEAEIVVSFELVENQVSRHEPAFIDFSVSNGGDCVLAFDLGTDRKANFTFKITEPGGAVEELPRYTKWGIAIPGHVSLQPGARYQQRLLINEWTRLSKIGDYRIEIDLSESVRHELGIGTSKDPLAVLLLTVDETDVGRLEQVCADLAGRLAATQNTDKLVTLGAAISYIDHPVAISYFQDMLRGHPLARRFAIEGLERVATGEAVQILSAALIIRKYETHVLARQALRRLYDRIETESLRTQIKEALRGTPSQIKDPKK